jgi:hypothetical protein
VVAAGEIRVLVPDRRSVDPTSSHDWGLRSIGMAASRVDEQVRRLGSLLEQRLEQLAATAVRSIREKVSFYAATEIVSDEQLWISSISNLRYLFGGLSTGQPFDTSAAAAIGTDRAEAGIPLPNVMEAFRVVTHHLWDAMDDLAVEPGIPAEARLRATALLWEAQDLYTDAMAEAYRQTAIQQMVDDEAQRSVLTTHCLKAPSPTNGAGGRSHNSCGCRKRAPTSWLPPYVLGSENKRYREPH